MDRDVQKELAMTTQTIDIGRLAERIEQLEDETRKLRARVRELENKTEALDNLVGTIEAELADTSPEVLEQRIAALEVGADEQGVR
jgi:predicted nuclease with TOPRIM domain